MYLYGSMPIIDAYICLGNKGIIDSQMNAYKIVLFLQSLRVHQLPLDKI